MKMSKVVGRADDMLIVRGVNVYPSEIEAVVLADDGVGPQYVLVVDARARVAPADRLLRATGSTTDTAWSRGRLIGALCAASERLVRRARVGAGHAAAYRGRQGLTGDAVDSGCGAGPRPGSVAAEFRAGP